MDNKELIKPITIGKVKLKNNLILAPMAGYGDIAFRRLCRDFGAGLTVTEMISCKGLLYDNKKTIEMLRIASNETPSCVQLFGSDLDSFERVIKSGVLDNFDIIDINMGCPVLKVTRCGEGSALLNNINLASKIVTVCVKSTDKPITVKIRLGYESSNPVPIAKALEDSGANAITVHGRTKVQLYSGLADWNEITKVAYNLKIPVIGNGDIDSVTSCYHRLKNNLVQGVMIGRGALGHADIFTEILGGMGEKRLVSILKHIDYMMEYFNEHVTVTEMRKHLGYYLKGMSNCKELKSKLNNINNVEELKQKLTICLKDENFLT